MKPKTTAILSALVTLIACQAPAISAELRSLSREIIVLQPHDLPEAAQVPGNSLFLDFDDEGRTFLHVGQKEGSRLAIFNVTDAVR